MPLNVTTDADAHQFANTGVDLTTTTYSQLASETLTDTRSANTAHDHVKAAITQLAADRATVGTNIESLTYYNDQLGTLKNNLSAANSRIVDVDVAQESTQYAKYNILVQTGTAMLAQANSLPLSALKLLG